MLPDATYKRWLYKRKLTMIGFAIQNVLIGADFSLTFITLWLYLKTLVKPNHKEVYYSIISASYLIASMSFSLVLGRIVDRSRKVRLAFVTVNIVSLIGNTLYTFQFSVWFLIIGRMLAGTCGPLRSVVSGELARSYSNHDLQAKLSIMGMAYSFGFVAGPAINFLFRNVDVTIGIWSITYVNAPGLLLAFLFAISAILSYFIIFDLSKEYDLKGSLEMALNKLGTIESQGLQNYGANKDIMYVDISSSFSSSGYNSSDLFDTMEDIMEDSCKVTLIELENSCKYVDTDIDSKVSIAFFKTEEKEEEEKESTPLLKQIGPTHDVPSVRNTIWKLIRNKDTLLILLFAFFENYFVVSFDIWIPLAVVEVMQWSITELNIIIFGSGLCCVGACLVLIWKPIPDSTVYILTILTTISIIFMEVFFITLADSSQILWLSILLWVMFCFCYCFLVITEEVFLVGCLAKMVSSRVQTTVDGIRLSMYRLGGLTALATSALLFQWINVVAWVHIGIAISGVALLILRRNAFRNPQMVLH